jgi:hypothetical protein
VAKKTKPNFSPYGNKKSGPQKGVLDQMVSDLLRPSKKFNGSRDHHDSRKGGGGNNTGKRG